LGKVTAVSALQCQDWYRATKGLWRQKMSLSGGGQLNDSGSHLLDIILWTTGLEPAEVSARCDNLDTEVDIVSALTVKFRGGAQGNISVVGHSPTWWEDITIWGTDGALFYRNGTLRHHVGFGKEVHEVSGFPSYGSPDRNFVDAILGKAEVQSPPVCGLRVTQLTEAAWKSSKLGGKPVKVAH
jgi:predicted dehydrogenase